MSQILDGVLLHLKVTVPTVRQYGDQALPIPLFVKCRIVRRNLPSGDVLVSINSATRWREVKEGDMIGAQADDTGHLFSISSTLQALKNLSAKAFGISRVYSIIRLYQY